MPLINMALQSLTWFLSTISSCEFCLIGLCKFACWTNKSPAQNCLPELWLKIAQNSVKLFQSFFLLSRLVVGLFCKNSLILWKCGFCLLHSKYSYFIFQRERKSGLKNSLYSYARTNNSFSLRIKQLKIMYFRRNAPFSAFYWLAVGEWLAGKWASGVLKCSLFLILYMTTTIRAAVWKKVFRPVTVYSAWHVSW